MTAVLTEDESRALGALVCSLTGPPRPDGPNAGSAIVLGDGRILTCRHILPEHAFEPPAGRELMALVDGRPVVYSVAEAGATAMSLTEDWAVLEIAGPDPPFTVHVPADIDVRFEADPDLEPGDEVLLIGFWEKAASTASPTFVRATIVKPPFGIWVPDEIICVETPTTDVLRGMSGGAAVVWDPAGRRATVVGLYRGMRQLEGFGRIWAGVHTVRRLPRGHSRRPGRPTRHGGIRHMLL